MKCQVTRPPDAVALQGQFLVRNRRERGGTREMLRGGGMVGLGLTRTWKAHFGAPASEKAGRTRKRRGDKMHNVARIFEN